jgi:hypothetical protein
MASANTDPKLREALRAINTDAPDVAALTAFADAVERAVREGATTSGAAARASGRSFASKLALASVISGTLAYAVLQRANVNERPATAAATQTAPTANLPSPPLKRSAVHPRSDKPAAVSGVLPEATALPVVEPAVRPPVSREMVPESTAGLVRSRGLAHATRRAPRTSGAVAGTAEPASTLSPSQQRETLEPEPPPSELSMLETAQRALLHDPQRVLEVLDQHRSAFPRGRFAQERDVLMLEALQQLHDTAALRTGAREFMQRYPRSPHRSRVEKLIEDLR